MEINAHVLKASIKMELIFAYPAQIIASVIFQMAIVYLAIKGIILILVHVKNVIINVVVVKMVYKHNALLVTRLKIVIFVVNNANVC